LISEDIILKYVRKKYHHTMSNHYCKYCGNKFISVYALTAASCGRHPDGCNKGKHALYEGSEKTQYICKHCGLKFPTIYAMTAQKCSRRQGTEKNKQHEPTL
jgi:DNA-directed RNA polymerase subunit RPC12/RpoP